RTSLRSELEYQSSLRVVEEASFSRGREYFTRAGITRAEVEEHAKEAVRRGDVEMRSRWERVLGVGRRKKGGIISSSWSAVWIRSILSAAADREVLDGIEVYANEILPSSSPKGIEEEEKGIFTSGDKLRVMNSLTSHHEEEERRRVVYIGDSATDLGCLLNADIGIVILSSSSSSSSDSSSEEISTVLKRLGIPLLQIREFSGRNYNAEEKEKTLWCARDFDEILESGIFNASDSGGSVLE
ncbi:MAG: hypothetical protein Q9191_008551, partial [Dirinaria sp. TL-2023a]